MFNRIAFLSVAALGAAALPHPAAAADFYDGEGGRSVVLRSRDDIEIDGDRARFAHRQEFRPAIGGYRRYPGPVVYDERGFDRRDDRPGSGFGAGDPGYGRPVAVERPVYGDGGPAYGARFDRPPFGDGIDYRPVPAYRAVSTPVAGFDERAGLPDVGCTVQQAQSTTPAGWRKIVTHRTCYRR